MTGSQDALIELAPCGLKVYRACGRVRDDTARRRSSLVSRLDAYLACEDEDKD